MKFRNLSEQEKQEFRNWARMNYTPNSPINGVWHPVVQEECVKMNSLFEDTGVPVIFTAGEWKGETGVLEKQVGDFYNVRPDKNKTLLLALKPGEFTLQPL